MTCAARRAEIWPASPAPLPLPDAPRRRCLALGLAWSGLAGVVSAMVGCSREGVDALSRLQQRSRMAVGYAVEPPYANLRSDGQVEGESPAVARRVAEGLGLRTIDWVQVEFAHLLDDLLARRFDLVASGLFITDERRQRVTFSRPTLRVREGWLARAGHPVATLSYAAARHHRGWRLAVLHGSLEERLLGSDAQAQVIAAPDVRTAHALVASGAADALALSLPTVRLLAARDPGRLIGSPAPPPPGSTEPPSRLVALAMHPQDRSLHAAVDGVLATYLGSERHLQDLQHLGLTADELPPKASS